MVSRLEVQGSGSAVQAIEMLCLRFRLFHFHSAVCEKADLPAEPSGGAVVPRLHQRCGVRNQKECSTPIISTLGSIF